TRGPKRQQAVRRNVLDYARFEFVPYYPNMLSVRRAVSPVIGPEYGNADELGLGLRGSEPDTGPLFRQYCLPGMAGRAYIGSDVNTEFAFGNIVSRESVFKVLRKLVGDKARTGRPPVWKLSCRQWHHLSDFLRFEHQKRADSFFRHPVPIGAPGLPARRGGDY